MRKPLPTRLPNFGLTPRLGRTRYERAQELPTCYSIFGKIYVTRRDANCNPNPPLLDLPGDVRLNPPHRQHDEPAEDQERSEHVQGRVGGLGRILYPADEIRAREARNLP